MSPLGPAPGRRILRITVSSPAGELEALFRPAAEALREPTTPTAAVVKSSARPRTEITGGGSWIAASGEG